MTERRDVLISETRKVLIGMHDPMAEMKLVDAVQRLGISYHFQDEIHASLQKLNSVEFNNESFHEISLQFRLLRQERYYMSWGNSLLAWSCLLWMVHFKNTVQKQYQCVTNYHWRLLKNQQWQYILINSYWELIMIIYKKEPIVKTIITFGSYQESVLIYHYRFLVWTSTNNPISVCSSSS